MAETNGENKIPGAFGGIYNGGNTNYEGKYNGVYGKIDMQSNAGTCYGSKEINTQEYSNVLENNTQTTNNDSTSNTSYSSYSITEGKDSTSSSFSTIGTTKNMPVKVGFWSKVKSFLFKEIDLNAPIKVELTPYQQKIEDEINDFLHQEITFSTFKNLFKK